MAHDSFTDTSTNMLAGYLKYRLEDMAHLTHCVALRTVTVVPFVGAPP